MVKNIVFAAIIAGIVALLYTLSMEEFPPIPSDKDHIKIISEEACQDCHGEGREHPLSKEHPPKHQCLKCHERELKRD